MPRAGAPKGERETLRGLFTHFFFFFFFFTQIPEIEASELTLPSATVMNVMIIFLFLS